MNRLAVFGVFGVLVTIVAPLYIAQNLEVGARAKSPQTITVDHGAIVVVGGGRGKLWMAGGETGGDFEIECQKETQFFSPQKSKVYQGCGMRIKLLQTQRKDGLPASATYRIEW